jgi:hypothetical protein
MMRLLCIAAAALALAGCGLQDPYSTSSTPARRQAPAVAPRATSTPSAAVSARGAAAPLASARLFMRGYLPYLYGLGPAHAIAAVTPAFRHVLAAQPMTREDGASPSHPQLEALRALSQKGRAAIARAIVSDESKVYFALDLALVRSDAGWQVSALKTVGG